MTPPAFYPAYGVELRYGDETIRLISRNEAGHLIALLFAWATTEITDNSKQNSNG